MNIRHASLSDVGVKRSHNQDACVSQPAADDAHFQSHGHVFLVADGMGGHAVGEKASAKAVGVIPLTFLKHVAQDGVPAALTRAFQEANAAIHQIGRHNPEFLGLGTTGTAVVLRPEGAWVAHVGDSRAYRIRGERVQQLTYDHSFAWELARRQGVDPEAFGDFKRNVITRSLGPTEEVEVDIEGPHPIAPGDLFLICSDGLTNEVTPEEIGAVARAFPPAEASRALVDLANARGGKDNVTCLLVQIPADAHASRVPGSGVVKVAARRVAAANRVVPWPFAALALGAALAAASVTLNLNAMRGLAIPAFGLATLAIVVGLIGLYLQLKRRNESEGGAPAHALGGLHLYREHSAAYTPELVARFAQFGDELKAALESAETPADWDQYAALTKSAESASAKGDTEAAFAARFKAAQLLAGRSTRRGTRTRGSTRATDEPLRLAQGSRRCICISFQAVCTVKLIAFDAQSFRFVSVACVSLGSPKPT